MIDVGKYFSDILTELPDKEYRETLYNSTTGKNIPGNVLKLKVKDVAVISKEDITGKSFDLSFSHYVGINSIGVEVELNLYVANVTEEVSDELFCVKKEDESIDIFKYKYTKCGNWSKRNPVSEAVFVKNSNNFTVGNSTVEDVYYITDDLYYDVYYNIYTVDGSDIPCINGYTIIETDRQTSEVRLKQNGQFFDVYTVDIVTTGNTTFNDNIRYIARNIPYQLHGEITQQTIDGVTYDKQYYYICYQNEHGETVWVNTNVYRLYKDGREYGDIDEPEEIPSEYDRYLIEKMTNYYAFLYKSTDFATEDAARRYIKNGITADLSKFVMIELTPQLSDEVEELPNGTKVNFYYVYYRDKSMRCDEYEIYTDTGGGEPEQPEIPDTPDPDPDNPDLPDVPSDPNSYYELKPLGDYILWQEYPEWYVIKWIYKVYYNGAVEKTDEYRVFAGPLEKVLNPDSREDFDWLRPRRYRIYYYVYWDDEATNTHFAQNTGLYEEYEYADDLEKDPDKSNCVNFEMTGWEGTISFNNVDNPNIEYAIGEGEWQTWDYSPIHMVTNQTVYFRGHNTRLGSSSFNMAHSKNNHFIISGDVKLAGNASSLLNGTGEDMTTDEQYVLCNIFSQSEGIKDISGFNMNVGGYGAFAYAFSFCTFLTSTCDWPETIHTYEFLCTYYGCERLTTVKPITYTSIPEYSFTGCFGRCTSLVEMPDLPATTLAPHCYAEMFMNSGVKSTKRLPATEIPESAYSLMFAYSEIESCADIDVVNASRMAFSGMYRDTKINTAPSFTITGTMGDNCFNQTFRNCGELTSSALITVDALSEYCFMYMYRGCKKLDYVRSLPWSLVKGCYDGMFQECTSLTESPRLAETTYAVDAYRQMFYGCTKLRTIDCNLLFDGEVIARSWVTNVSSTGTFYKNKHQENVYYSNDCVPVGWTVYDNNYSDVRLELYGDYELIKNEDNTYNLIQYFYNCTYIDDVLESAEKTDKYATIAQDLQRKLYDTTEIIEIEGETYEVRYYYVEFRGVKYKTNEYQIIVKTYTVQWFVPNYYNISENVLVHTDKINQNENIVSPYDYKFGGNDVVWVDSNNNRVSFPQTITEDTNYYVKFVKDSYNYLPNSVFKIDGDGYYTENCSRICGDLSISYNTSGNPEFWWKRSTNPKLEIIPPNGYQVHSIIFNGLIGGGIISESDNASYIWFDSDRSLGIYKTNSEIIEDRFVYKTEDNTDRWFSNFQIVFSFASQGQQIENVFTTWDAENIGINTGVYPTINTRMSIEASNLYGEGDINIGIAKDGTIPWKNDNGDNPDNSDWRLFMYGGSIYWDFGNRRKQIDYTGSKCRYECSSKGFEVYDIINKNLIYSDVDYYLTSINVSNYPIWIAPMTSRKHYATYYGIMIYEGEQLIRHYIPWRDKDGVVCFKEEINNKLCYPQVGTWTTNATNHYTFTFDSNGGSYVKPITQEHGTKVTVPNPTREGFTFIGWDPEIPEFMPDHDMTFTAQWEIHEHRAVFHFLTHVYEQTVKYNWPITPPNYNPTYDKGSFFIGWYPEIPEFMPDHDMTFTPVWHDLIPNQQIENVLTTWDEKNVGINTGVYPTIDTKMIVVVSDIYGEGDINIGIAADGTKPWRNDGKDENGNDVINEHPDDKDWRLTCLTNYYAEPYPSIYWHIGDTFLKTDYDDLQVETSICTYICSSKGLKKLKGDRIIYDESVNSTFGVPSNCPIWIAPRTYRKHFAKYYDIKIYEGEQLIRHYIPWCDENKVVCFKEEISNTLCYPQVGTWHAAPNPYKVVFVSENKVFKELNVYCGVDIPNLGEVPEEAPVREGYTFMGWDPEIPDFMPNHDMTFTANWEKI